MAREQKYDVLRGLAIICVMAIHISSSYTYVSSPQYAHAILNFINKLTNIAVPVFVALTVFLGLKSGKPRGIGYIAKKALPLAALYIVWSALYLVYRVRFEGAELPSIRGLIFGNLLQGQSCYHLYYIILLLQLYIIIAVLSHITPITQIKPRAALLPAAAAAQLAITLIMRPIFTRHSFVDTSVMPIYFITSIVCGVMLAADTQKTEAIFRLHRRGYASALLAAAVLRAVLADFPSRPFGGGFIQSVYEAALRELFILGIPTLFLLAERLKGLSPLALLGRHSLGIYFAHPLLLFVIEKIGHFDENAPLLGTAVKSAALLGFAFAFSWISERLKPR